MTDCVICKYAVFDYYELVGSTEKYMVVTSCEKGLYDPEDRECGQRGFQKSIAIDAGGNQAAQKFSRKIPTLCHFMMTIAKRDQVIHVFPFAYVLSQWNDMMYGYLLIVSTRLLVVLANQTTISITLTYCLSCPEP